MPRRGAEAIWRHPVFKTWEEMSDLEQAAVIYSDMHKDAYGFRPRDGGVHRPETLADYEAAFASMQRTIEREEAERAERETAALLAFNAELSALQADHGIDRTTALRWWFEANGYERPDYGHGPQDCRQQAEMVLWQRGLPYSAFKALAEEFLPRA